MAFKTFTDGAVLSDVDLNDYLMRQAVIKCTSGTRPSSPTHGMVIFETDTNRLRIHDGTDWSTVSYADRNAGGGQARVGTTTRVVDSANITTTETVTDLVNVFLRAGSTYRVRCVRGWASTTAGDSVFGRIREDDVGANPLQLARTHLPISGAGTRWDGTIEAEYTATTTGSKTFVATGIRASGAGVIVAPAAAAFPAYLYVDYVRG